MAEEEKNTPSSGIINEPETDKHFSNNSYVQEKPLIDSQNSTDREIPTNAQWHNETVQVTTTGINFIYAQKADSHPIPESYVIPDQIDDEEDWQKTFAISEDMLVEMAEEAEKAYYAGLTRPVRGEVD